MMNIKHVQKMLELISKDGRKFDFGGSVLNVGIELFERNERFVIKTYIKNQDCEVMPRDDVAYFRDNMIMFSVGDRTLKMSSRHCFEMAEDAFFVRGSDKKMDEIEDELTFTKDETKQFAEYFVCLLGLIKKSNTLKTEEDLYLLLKEALGIDLSKERFCTHCKKYENIDKFRNNEEDICAEWIVQYVPCQSCGELLSPKQFKLFTIKGKSHCKKCILEPRDKGKARWVGYSDKPSPKFYGEKNTGYFFGVEVEYECPTSNRIYNHKDISDIVAKCGEHIYFKSDGSLSNGSELITQPATLAYHAENTVPMLEILHQLECHADNNSTCGLHAHVGKDVFNNNKEKGRLIWLMDCHWDNFVKLSRRNSSNMRWCKRPDRPNGVYESKFSRGMLGSEKTDTKSADHSTSYYNAGTSSERYKAINMRPSTTIELRIADGTLTPRFFMGTLEMFSRMIDIAKSDLDFTNISFMDLFYKQGYEALDIIIDELVK